MTNVGGLLATLDDSYNGLEFEYQLIKALAETGDKR